MTRATIYLPTPTPRPAVFLRPAVRLRRIVTLARFRSRPLARASRVFPPLFVRRSFVVRSFVRSFRVASLSAPLFPEGCRVASLESRAL